MYIILYGLHSIGLICGYHYVYENGESIKTGNAQEQRELRYEYGV
jgi:hypothetical protein